jgi:hypothetical protein
MKPYASALGALLLATGGLCDARVHSVRPAQEFALPSDANYQHPGSVAIDGDAIIWLIEREDRTHADLYRRGSNGQWAFARTLISVNATGAIFRNALEIGDGVASILINEVMYVFERRANGDWTEAPTAGTPRPAMGMAVSGRRILTARRGCEFDADLHEKSLSSGVWRINGRIEGGPGECNDHGAPLDLDGDVALVVNSPSEVREYRRNPDGTWPQVGVIVPPSGVQFLPSSRLALRGNIAFAGSGDWFRRDGSTWSRQGKLVPLDHANGTSPGAVDYRGDAVITSSVCGDIHCESYFYLYTRNAGGTFDHSAVLYTFGGWGGGDVSGNTAAVSSIDLGGTIYLSVFNLPAPLAAPAAIANDFEAGDTTGWQRNSTSQFALATTPLGTVYRQSSLAGEARAWLTASDWPNAQSVSADIKPTAFNGSDKWFGLAVRYVDASNYYYVSLRNTNRLQLKRKLNGVLTTLVDRALPVTLNRSYHIELLANGPRLEVRVDDNFFAAASDTAHARGRVALLTSGASADFDNVFAGTTAPFNLAYKDLPGYGYTWGRNFTEVGGEWTWIESPDGTLNTAQTSTEGDARAHVGAFTDDQVVQASLRLDSYDASPQGAWFGLLARRVDERTYYYLTVRSTGQLEIRRQLNGTVTVLKSVPFTATPGRFYNFKLSVIKNELHAYVDGVFVGGALDDSIRRGNYGVGSYRTAFTYGKFTADQP